MRQLTNSAATITDTYDYDPFGNKINSTGTTPNNYLYRGEQWDADLGLYYLSARYYNTMTGRFMSRDPEDGIPPDPVSLHRNLYAADDPINRIDPTGRTTDVLKPVVGGDTGEYTGLISAISLTVQVAAVAVATTCVLDYAASQLGYEPAFSFCAKKRKYSCSAKCTCHVIGGEDHENTGTFVTGSGTGYSLSEARNAAKRDAGLSCAAGQHAQHCSYQCTE